MRVALLAVLLVSCKDGSASKSSVSSAESPTHEIVLTPVTTIHGVGDSIDLTIVPPARSRQGVLAVPVTVKSGDAIALYDSTGRFLRRLGRGGRGPGEFERITGVAFGPGDTLWVSDASRQLSLFAPPSSGTFVRALQLETPITTGRATPYGILGSGTVTSSGLMPARVLLWDGQTVRTFGADAPTKPVENRMGPVGLADSMHAWVAYPNAYRLDLLGADGQVHQGVERSVPWFPTDAEARRALWQRQQMPPLIHAVGVDEGGRLWVYVRRGRGSRRPPTSPRPGIAMRAGSSGGRPSADRMVEDWEGILDVIDPSTSDLIATRPMGGGVLGFLGADLLYEVTTDSLGLVSGQLYRISLTPKPGTPVRK